MHYILIRYEYEFFKQETAKLKPAPAACELRLVSVAKVQKFNSGIVIDKKLVLLSADPVQAN